MQLAIIGKGDEHRRVLLPAEIATRLLALRNCMPAEANVFGIEEREINYLIKRTAARAGVDEAASAHRIRHAHASHAIDNGAPITVVSQTLGHADLKTTSVYPRRHCVVSGEPTREFMTRSPDFTVLCVFVQILAM